MLVPSQRFDKEFQENIVQSDTGHGHQKITDQLDTPPQVRPLEHHVHAEVKTDRERNKKGHDKSRHVGLKCQHTHMHHLLVQHKIVKHVVKKNIEQRIAAAAGCVVIGLQGHKAFEQRIKNIQYGKDGFPHPVVNLTH